MQSPYDSLPVKDWYDCTLSLVQNHPLNTDEIYSVVHQVWNDIFLSGIGSKPFRIGTDIFPRPQVMAFFLHELIPLEFAHRYPGQWRREQTVDEKDLVFIPNPNYSIEIKTSSSTKGIYGNRSYTQEAITNKKTKSGYYLAVNFEKFTSEKIPQITAVRFGWLDITDWIGQAAPTGQQARLTSDAANYKLLTLPLQIRTS